MKTGVVFEGGGMRGLFTAGVIDAMLDLARYRAIYQEFRLIGTEFATVEQTKNLTVMKRICLSLFALLLVIGIQAAPVKPVTVLLMDSANSLINGASILANATLLSTTSWDGRALICVVDRLPIQVVAPHRDTLRTTIIPDQAGQTVILRMSDKRYAPEVVVGSLHNGVRPLCVIICLFALSIYTTGTVSFV